MCRECDFDVGQPCLRRRATAGTSRVGGSSPTGMSRMSSRLTCQGGFHSVRSSPTSADSCVRCVKTLLKHALLLWCHKGSAMPPPVSGSPPLARGSFHWAGRTCSLFFRSRARFLQILNLQRQARAFFMIKAVNRGLTTLFSLRSADLLLLNQSGDAAPQRSLGENWRPLSAKTLFRDGTRWPIAGPFRIRVEHQQKREKKTNKDFVFWCPLLISMCTFYFALWNISLS